MPRQVESTTSEIRALLNRRSAATYLGISPWTLDRLVRRAEVRPIHLTPKGPLMFRVRDLNALIDKRASSRAPKPKLRGRALELREVADAR